MNQKAYVACSFKLLSHRKWRTS